MLLDRPHLRHDGVYVSRNTYIKQGIKEWTVQNPVHLVCYFRYYLFRPDGRMQATAKCACVCVGGDIWSQKYLDHVQISLFDKGAWSCLTTRQ